jgi:Domain of unknown function (DUF6089)
MKRTLVVIILLCMVAHIAISQELWRRQRYEALASIGTTQFFGDVGGFSKSEDILGLKDISFLQTRFNFTLGLKYKILSDLNIRLNLAYGMLHATDARGSNEHRGFEANTSIFEPSLLAEYYFIKSKLGESYLFSSGQRLRAGNLFSSLEFYVFTGLGGLSFNVNRNAALAAKGLTNSGFTGVIPVGLGVNLLFKPEYNLGLELGGRYSFSDYLDAYTSPSQQSNSNDVYYFLNVTFTYKINTSANGLPSFLSKRRF